ncbi:diguanylate cyclase [Selenomonas ruminantium]|uniref:sensor domain-containing diguanylate cyclase n=1 Tax=Selenomonas ruminantium TaxID=971 RepID=UPI0003FCAEB5|nr:diguanylate cyclase [Selenomonas ruminantium]
MLQKKYVFHTFDELESIAAEITSSNAYRNASGILLQLYNPKIDTADEEIIAYLHAACEKACLVGLTCANIADQEFDIKDEPIELNVTYFQTTRLLAFDFDMNHETGFVAGRILNNELEDIYDARCMLVCYSCGSAVINAFTNEFSHHKLPLFGAKAGRSIRALNTALVYGRSTHANGIVAIVFAGEDLHLYMDNCLGFKEIGLKMRITKTEGDHIITEIDHKPATEVYSKYLNVKPNKYFVHNVCEFPLIFSHNDCIFARVPFACGEDGSIHFTAGVEKGAKFRLSYGNPDNLFNIIDQSVQNLKKFNPEAVFLFECGNRVRFLKDQARHEPDKFRKYSPELSVAVGYAELFFAPIGGNVLNSALVAVGLTENASSRDEIRTCIKITDEKTYPEEQENEVIPFVDRILHFLEKTSLELDQLNRELGKIAYTDRLTRIYNRWELEHKINEAIVLSEDDHRPISLIFMDIDHFKHVNDTYGHDVGDMVLRTTVDLIKDNLQPQHVFGRWGGEEFLYLLPDTDLEKAKEFAEKLRLQVEANCYVVVRHVTMSFGVTSIMEGDDMNSFVKRADEALYIAKESGRNRVVTKSSIRN